MLEVSSLRSPSKAADQRGFVGDHVGFPTSAGTVFVDFRNDDGLRKDTEESKRDGFVGRLAIHPAQVPVINAVFQPSAEQIAHAQKIVAAFAAQPNAGTVGIDGKMFDRPHLVRVTSAQNDISRNHVEILLEDWHVLIRDLGSTNGTTVALPGQHPVRLRPSDQPITLRDQASSTTARYTCSPRKRM